MAGMPERLGDFELLEKLGSGGFGSVFLGQDSDGRRAAVKVLHPHMADDAKVRELFARELTAARQVQGFCLAEILQADPDADPPWIASEYVEGPTLEAAVRDDGPRSGGDLQRLAVQTATALSAIHAAGVVHRDFKPDNIMLAREGPRVIDFGVARAVEASAVTSATMVGTAGYMPPEQLEGKRLTTASDVFAWGVVMVFAATGRRAFPGDSNMARIAQVLTGEADLTGVEEPLRGVVDACLRKDPEQRPTARQVLDALLSGTAPDSPARGADGPAAEPAPSAPADPATPPAGSAAAAPPDATIPATAPHAAGHPGPGPGGPPADAPMLGALLDASAAWQRAHTAAQDTSGDPGQRAHALLAEAEALVVLERYTDAERLIALAEQATTTLPPAANARLQLCRAEAAFRLGRHTESDIAYQHAESVARHHQLGLIITRCCSGRGELAALNAESLAADHYFRDALDGAMRCNAPLLRCEALLRRAQVQTSAMRFTAVGQLADEAAGLARQLGCQRFAVHATFLQAVSRWHANTVHTTQHHPAEPLAWQATEQAQQLGFAELHTQALSTWALIAVSLHRGADAHRAAEHAAGVAEGLESTRVKAEVLFTVGKVYRKLGARQQAAQVLDRALALARSIGMRPRYEAHWDRWVSRVVPW